jgi:hypothetical protein
VAGWVEVVVEAAVRFRVVVPALRVVLALGPVLFVVVAIIFRCLRSRGGIKGYYF